MNSLWGRSKSKHRKVGNLKDRIGNPTPLEPININGSFIDLKISPQDGRVPLAAVGVSPVHRGEPAHPATASAGGAELNGGEYYTSKLDPRPHQPGAPARPSRADDQYQVQEYLRGNGDNDGRLATTASDEYVSEWDGNNGEREDQEHYPRPYSPEQSGSSERRNFSRPAVTPDPDEVGHFVVPSFSSHSSSTSSNPTVRTRNQEQSHLTLRTGASSSSTPGTQSPVTYQPYSPTTQYTARGRQTQREDSGLPTVDRFQGGNTPLAIVRSATESRGSDSSDYSSANSIEGPLAISQPFTLSYYQTEQTRHRPLKLDIQPARELQQAETAKYFEAFDSGPEEPVSPLLPSPRRYNFAPQDEPVSPVSPVSGPTSTHFSHGLEFNLVGETPTEPTDTTFIDFSMPSPVMGARGRPAISAPQSPEHHNLPAYLGKLQPVQRGPDFYDKPTGGVPSGPKRSLSRKVSTRLRTLVGAGNRPREETLPEDAALTSPSRDVSRDEIPQLPSLDSMKDMNMDALSGSATATSTSQQQIGAEMDDIMARFDVEHDTRPTYQVQEVHGKVDDWSYYPSAASSASNLSLRPSYKSSDNATLATESDNPGLSSQHSSTRSSHRNVTPETPATPADDGYSFSALRGHPGIVGTHKSDMTVRQQDYMQGPRKFSEEVPVFLDTTTEVGSAVPSFTHEPPTPDPHKTTFSRIHHDSIMPEPAQPRTGKHDSHFTDTTSSTGFTMLTRPSPTISTAPTSAATSPMLPTTPISPTYNRSPTARKPPFGPGSPRMMLRTATMSSRPGGGTPLKPKPVAPPITEEEAASNPPSRNNSGSERSMRMEQSPTSPYARSGSAFSFIRDDFSVIRPDDSISQMGNNNQSVPSSPLSRSASPTPFDVDRSLSKVQVRPKTASRAQNDRVAALSRFDDAAPRPSTGTPARNGLRVNTDLQPPALPARSFSAAEVPRSATVGGLAPPPVVKRSKSVGEGLKRAFSRRPPKAPLPSVDSGTPPPIPEDGTDHESGANSPVTEVSGPLGCGTSSEMSKARWNSAIRAAAVSSTIIGRSGSNGTSRPGAMLDSDAVPASSNPNRASVILKAQPLTAEEKQGMHHAPGTLFIRTCEEDENGVGECKEHRMKPRKGGTTQKCAFCLKGPFANMWVCLDGEDGVPEAAPENARLGGVRERDEKKGGRCGFAICRMCCNEQVQEGQAEIF